MNALTVAALLTSTLALGADKPRVRTVAPQRVESTASERVTGQLFPAKIFPMGFEVGGRLKVSAVTKGQVVKAGALLGKLDSEIIDSQVDQARASVNQAQAGASLARDVASRNAKLLKEDTVSGLQAEQTNTQAVATEAQLAQARAGLAQALAGQRRHVLYAPYAGTIVDAPEQTDGMVAPGMPVYILMQLDPLTLKATIPERARPRITVGSKVTVQSVGGDARTTEARVKSIIPSADPQTHRVPIEIEVPNADGRFVANSLARAEIPLGKPREAYKVPATSLTASGDTVFVVNPGNTVSRVQVTIIERQGQEVTVIAQKPLPRVVDYPASTLVDGTSVEVPTP